MKHYSAPKKMKSISSLFDRYKKVLKAPQGSVEKVFIKVVTETMGFELQQSQISYHVPTRTMHLAVPSLLKSEIKLKKTELLSLLTSELGDGAPVEII